MDNIYGDTASAGEGSSASFLEPGLHAVKIKSVDLIAGISTANYQGDAADIVFQGLNGGTLTHRFFPYKYNPSGVNHKGEPMSQEDQFNDYFGKLNHIFFKGAGGETLFKEAANGASGFANYVARVSTVVCNQPLWIMVKANDNGYSKLCFWRGGSAEVYVDGTPCGLRWDESKYGKKTPVNAEVKAGEPTNELSFLDD